MTEAQTFDDHDPDSTVSLTLIPAPALPRDLAGIREGEEGGEEGEEAIQRGTETERDNPTQALYTALSACANLHPDPLSDSEVEDGDEGQRQRPGILFESDDVEGGVSGLPPPMPGSGGWITAENVGEFFDEEGNWRGRGGGSGVGNVRGREEEEGEGEGDGEETKWRRTE